MERGTSSCGKERSFEGGLEGRQVFEGFEMELRRE